MPFVGIAHHHHRTVSQLLIRTITQCFVLWCHYQVQLRITSLRRLCRAKFIFSPRGLKDKARHHSNQTSFLFVFADRWALFTDRIVIRKVLLQQIASADKACDQGKRELFSISMIFISADSQFVRAAGKKMLCAAKAYVDFWCNLFWLRDLLWSIEKAFKPHLFIGFNYHILNFLTINWGFTNAMVEMKNGQIFIFVVWVKSKRRVESVKFIAREWCNSSQRASVKGKQDCAVMKRKRWSESKGRCINFSKSELWSNPTWPL